MRKLPMTFAALFALLFLATSVSNDREPEDRVRHRGVTRNVQTLGTMDPAQLPTFSQQTEVQLAPEWNPSELKVVVFLQATKSKRIIGAASIAAPL